MRQSALGGRPVPAVLLLLSAVAVAGFYDVGQVNEIRLTFVEPNWDEILDSLYEAGEEGRLTGTAVVNGTRFDSVGVRYKGASSYNPSRRKNPLNVKLDHVIAGRNIEGHGTLRLANIYKDPSCVREVLAYEIARRYMPAGRSNFANVYVNDTLLGLYTSNEDPDKMFVRTHFYGDENARFKGRLTDRSQMIGWKYFGADSTPYLDYFERESDTGWSEIAALFDTLNTHGAALDRILNIDRHLWMLAFDVLLVNLDAPINMPQNHYLYRDHSRRFNPVVWDLNESFGAYRDLNGTGQLSLAQMQQLDPFLRSTDTNYPIASRVLDDARRRRVYVAHMKTVLEEVFSDNWYRERAYELQEMIDAHVRADPNKFYTYNDFTNNVTRSVGSGPLAIVGLTELMNARADYLSTRPEFAAAPPAVAEASLTPARPAPNSAVRFSARVTGADSVFLGWRQNRALRFNRVTLLPESGEYAAVVDIGAGDIEYFVYAENDSAGVFYPARAEHEFFTAPVTGGAVINEFQAQNVSTMPDPAGQYDDWIELHNTTGYPLSLDGYFLSDDSTHPLKWSFPDTTIPPGGYVVVWADDDVGQPGLHASFRLNQSGEMVILTDPDGFGQDRVVFGPQAPDLSFGRFPDGLGRFMAMNPTFGRANDSGTGIVEQRREPGASCRVTAGPNPFSRNTVVHYTLNLPGRVCLRVFDPAGRLVTTLFDGRQEPGRYEAGFATAGRPGIYFAQLSFDGADGSHRTESVKLVRSR